ncbi:hCG1985787 [Homo sapiens]|uniref:HCG1985787 n=1 Tax=Homo sapiens TaxID=9606 RepID=Q96NP2_HUMAN|nr:hCG1985787 [Homo sapiens]BAB70837.1 unnamed protein product [Homo sapiens]
MCSSFRKKSCFCQNVLLSLLLALWAQEFHCCDSCRTKRERLSLAVKPFIHSPMYSFSKRLPAAYQERGEFCSRGTSPSFSLGKSATQAPIFQKTHLLLVSSSYEPLSRLSRPFITLISSPSSACPRPTQILLFHEVFPPDSMNFVVHLCSAITSRLPPTVALAIICLRS